VDGCSAGMGRMRSAGLEAAVSTFLRISIALPSDRRNRMPGAKTPLASSPDRAARQLSPNALANHAGRRSKPGAYHSLCMRSLWDTLAAAVIGELSATVARLQSTGRAPLGAPESCTSPCSFWAMPAARNATALSRDCVSCACRPSHTASRAGSLRLGRDTHRCRQGHARTALAPRACHRGHPALRVRPRDASLPTPYHSRHEAKATGTARESRTPSRNRPSAKLHRVVAEEFLLYESFLGPAGSRYEIASAFPSLAGSANARRPASAGPIACMSPSIPSVTTRAASWRVPVRSCRLLPSRRALHPERTALKK